MKKVAIVGAGQLGSRHLQAIALHEKKLDIYVVDPIEESLNRSKERFLEVDNYRNKRLAFMQSMKGLPPILDFVIIATNSLQRLSVLKELLQISKVQYLLLEKFLFPKVEEYEEALKLIEEKQVKAYVNCARRMWLSYQKLKDKMSLDSNIRLSVSGSNWNLSSNAIHFLDLFFYLTNEKMMALDTQELDKDLAENKRLGYIDFTGIIKGVSANGNKLSLTSTLEGNSAPDIIIESDQRTFIINEGLQKIQKEAGIMSFPITPISEISHKIFQQLIETDNCDLVTFERSVQDHLLLLNAFNRFLNGREGAIT